MAWSILFVAGLLEITWAIGLKYTEGFTRPVPSVITLTAMAGSVILLGLALKSCRSEPPMQSGPASARSAPRRSASSCSANLPPRFASPASA